MLRGETIGLRALHEADIEILETELLNDVMTRVRSDSRPWRPVAPGSADSPYRNTVDPATVARFAAEELATGELAGEAVMFEIDLHNRNAHIGLALRPAFRGRHLGTDLVRVLCRYGFEIRGLHRLQVDTLTDNHAMIGAANRAGFVAEGVHRQVGWVNGRFADGVVLGQLATEWLPGTT
ncbi:MAG: GNAT family protein [Streptosporangiaceae bacterium]|jgi:RimJ/RimL family protein N-acetyltransferase